MNIRALGSCLVGVALMAGVAPVTAGSTIYVDDDAPPGGDGSSWALALTFLQDGLAAASQGGAGEVRIAGGEYRPDRRAAFPGGTGSRDATFTLVPGVAHLGGFAGVGAPDPDMRDTALHESVLSGDLAGNDGPGFAGNGENSRHVATATGGNATLDGVTVRGGNGPLGGGGGLLAEGDGLTLRGVRFEDNDASAFGGLGGAVRFAGTASVSDCVFDGNRSWHGGAIVALAAIQIEDCLFTRNEGLATGGAIDIRADDCSISRSVFSGNSTDGNGAGIHSVEPFDADNCLFSGNNARRAGGGILVTGGGTFTIRNCTFQFNTGNYLGGGAIYLESSNANVARNCILWRNSSTAGADEIQVSQGAIDVRYSLVTEGWPGEGNLDEDPSFVEGPAGTWTADATYDAEQDQTTFVDATATFSDDAFFARLLIPYTVITALNSSVVSNTATTITVQGDLAALGFAGATYEVLDHHVVTGSPAVDAGDNAGVGKGTIFDLDGNPRFVDDPDTPDTGSGEPPLVDMGVYEFQGACPADLDGSGAVDFGDILAVLAAWGNVGGAEDLDNSGTVDFGDLLVVLSEWGPCP